MKNIVISISVLFSVCVHAQTIERQILNTAGGVMTASGVMLRTNIGEPIIGKTGTNTLLLSQGFYTGGFDYISVSVPDAPQKISIDIYPNPTKAELFFRGDISKANSVEVMNMFGQVLFVAPLTLNNIKLDQLPAGIFFVNLFDQNHQRISSIRFVKIRL